MDSDRRGEEGGMEGGRKELEDACGGGLDVHMRAYMRAVQGGEGGREAGGREGGREGIVSTSHPLMRACAVVATGEMQGGREGGDIGAMWSALQRRGESAHGL